MRLLKKGEKVEWKNWLCQISLCITYDDDEEDDDDDDDFKQTCICIMGTICPLN